MSWFKVDDKLHSHPKVATVDLEAMGLWALCGSYCSDQLTDGFVPWPVVYRYARGTARGKKLSRQLIASGLWTDGEKGPSFHQYLDRNPSREKLLQAREKTLERVERHRAKKGSSNGVTNGVGNGGCNPPCNAAPVPVPVPVPSSLRSESHLTSFDDLPGPVAAQAPSPVAGRRSAKGSRIRDDLDPASVAPEARAASEAIASDETLAPICRRPVALARDLCRAAPGIDVAAQVCRAGAWLRANPAKRKSNGNKFLLNWLTKQQDERGGRSAVVPFERRDDRRPAYDRPFPLHLVQGGEP